MNVHGFCNMEMRTGLVLSFKSMGRSMSYLICVIGSKDVRAGKAGAHEL